MMIWPTAFIAAFAQYALAHNYLIRYLSEQKLEIASNTDFLTGVSNRRYFLPLLGLEMSRCQRYHHSLSLLMMDVDHFKQINDTYGHISGDVVLCKIVGTCCDILRENDIIARMGGEEFAILLPETDIKGAVALAERIRSAVEYASIHSASGQEIHCTVSIGIAELRIDDIVDDQFIGRADHVLYYAKSLGRNHVCSQEMLPSELYSDC